MKDNKLSFSIEGIDLYLEYVLVDYMDIPIFFLCKGNEEYYIVLCVDINELNYYIIRSSTLDVSNLLHSKITIRDIFLKQSNYWFVKTGDDIKSDVVLNNSIKSINVSNLPEENDYFEVLDDKTESFVQNFDQHIYQATVLSTFE